MKNEKKVINSFDGEYDFLSNFYPCESRFKGIVYPSAEHVYQASKTDIQEERIAISKMKTPGQAKRLGRKITLRDDWEKEKLDMMYIIVFNKFFLNRGIRNKLFATGDAEIIEGNYWNDHFWGVCGGVGENHLGKTLMKVREDLKHYDWDNIT